MANTFIYALCDPGTRTVRYIGKSNRPQKRLIQHISCSVRHRSHLGSWLTSLRTRGLRPALVVLKEVSELEWEQEEIRYIRAAHVLGMDLVNSTEGGDAPKHSPETLEKIASKLRGRPRPQHVIEAIRAAHTGRKHTPEQRAAKSEANSGTGNPFFGKRHSPESLEKQRLAKLGKKHSPETCAKMGASRAGAKNHNFGKTMSEEQKNQLSVALTGRKLSLEHRVALSIAGTGRKHSEETLNKMRASRLAYLKSKAGE